MGIEFKPGFICPCCGQPVTTPRLLVDLNTNMAVRLGARAQLTRQEAEAAYILASRFPRVVPWGEFGDELYGPSHGRDLRSSTFYALLSYLRRKLAPLGARIENTHGIGWRLVLA